MSTTSTRADVCAAAIADAFKDDGEIFASPMGLLPMLGVRLAKLTSNPDLVISDGESLFLAGVPPLFAKGDVVEGWIPFRKVFDVVAYGKRHVMMGATQVDRHGNQNISAIGDFAQPKRQLLGSRGAPGNTVNNRTSYWVPKHSTRVFVERVDIVSGVGPKLRQGGRAGGRPLQRHPPDRQQPRRSSTSRAPTTRVRLLSVHPGVTVDEVREATGFELDVPADVPDDPRAHRRGADPDPGGARPEGPALQGGPAGDRMIEQLLRTPFTDLVGVRHPVVQTGMGWVSGPRLVSGTANAGGLGILASATMTFDELEQAIVEVKGRTDQPFGVNLRADAADAAGALRPADRVRREGRLVRARPQAGADRQAQGARHRRDAVDRCRQARREGRGLGRRRGDGPGRRGRRPHRPGADHAAAADGARRRRHPGRSPPAASSTAAASPPRCRTAPPGSAWAPASC